MTPLLRLPQMRTILLYLYQLNDHTATAVQFVLVFPQILQANENKATIRFNGMDWRFSYNVAENRVGWISACGLSRDKAGQFLGRRPRLYEFGTYRDVKRIVRLIFVLSNLSLMGAGYALGRRLR